MKEYIGKVSEMNDGKLTIGGFVAGKSKQTTRLVKSCAGLIGVLLFCASGQVAAEVGQKPFPKIEGGSGEVVRPPSPAQDVRRPVPDPSGGQACAAEVDEVSATAQLTPGYSAQEITNYVVHERKRWVSRLCTDASRDVSDVEKYSGKRIADLSATIGKYDQEGQRAFRYMIAQERLTLCLARAKFSDCNRSPPATVPGSPRTPQLSANTAPTSPPYSLASSSSESQRINNDLNQARALAQRNQERADQARQGLPKLHKGGSVAHACLKPQPGGGMLNDCPYAVEYSYCVLHPAKGSWSEAFDCDKGLGGSWQVGAGPGKPVLIHMGGETTYWFACRYGETLQKPDGISPVDIEYQRGRGLVGRCGEWGSSKGK